MAERSAVLRKLRRQGGTFRRSPALYGHSGEGWDSAGRGQPGIIESRV